MDFSYDQRPLFPQQKIVQGGRNWPVEIDPDEKGKFLQAGQLCLTVESNEYVVEKGYNAPVNPVTNVYITYKGNVGSKFFGILREDDPQSAKGRPAQIRGQATVWNYGPFVIPASCSVIMGPGASRGAVGTIHEAGAFIPIGTYPALPQLWCDDPNVVKANFQAYGKVGFLGMLKKSTPFTLLPWLVADNTSTANEIKQEYDGLIQLYDKADDTAIQKALKEEQAVVIALLNENKRDYLFSLYEDLQANNLVGRATSNGAPNGQFYCNLAL